MRNWAISRETCYTLILRCLYYHTHATYSTYMFIFLWYSGVTLHIFPRRWQVAATFLFFLAGKKHPAALRMHALNNDEIVVRLYKIETIQTR